ncbi:YciI family protein [Variovorax sp. HJSM1_2]|uniref:YciI family protein n=1 Tax=Variovorax sp. HJSM1_2 TaxID=3366263 RepID=UPI003BDDF394
MPFAITFFDKPGTDKSTKSSFRQTHIDYVSSKAKLIIASGGLFPDDDDFPNGGLILLDVQTRGEAVQYIENDPFFIHGIFNSYNIVRWKKFVFDHQRV